MGGGQAPLISDNGTLRQVSAQLQIMVNLPAVKETVIPIKIAGIEFFGRKNIFLLSVIRLGTLGLPARVVRLRLPSAQ